MSGFITPQSPLLAAADPPGTDDELSALLGSLRRHVLEVAEGVWEPAVRDAAKIVSAALVSHLDPERQH